LTQDKQVQIPKQGERRERELQELVKKGKRPVALFVDEAHDLNGHTLIGLKRLMEVVEDGGGRCRLFWPVTPNCAMTCDARLWRRSVIARISLRWMGSPVANGNIFSGY
jgi:type II secretory pathway predicted ATPase ExeA